MKTVWQKKRIRNTIKAVVFLLLLVTVITATSRVLGMQDDMYTAHAYDQFYGLPENTVDVLTLGSSGTREFYNVSEAYAHNGITCATLASSNQPFIATKYLIKETEKTQHPKVYVIDVRELEHSDNPEYATYVRIVSDSMRFSWNRLDFINHALDIDAQINPEHSESRLNYYFSYFLYHSRWDELTYHDFDNYSDVSWLGFSIYSSQQQMDGRPDLISSYGAADLTEVHREELEEVLAYCTELHESQGTEFLFIDPIAWSEEEVCERTNTVKQMVEAAGFPFVDTRVWFDDMGLDNSTDFRDAEHVNIWGSFKYTDFLADYLKIVYELEDHRGDERYSAWQDNYNQFIMMYNILEAQRAEE